MKVNSRLANGALLVVSLLHLAAAATRHDTSPPPPMLLQPMPLARQHHHQKRQIYREQVLPHAGGKIPDSAFETQRLALNRLQKDGIAVPDGVLLEQRNPQVFQYPVRSQRPVYRVRQTGDERFAPAEGGGASNGPNGGQLSVESTYSLPQVTQHRIVRPRDPERVAEAGDTGDAGGARVGVDPVEPVLTPFELPNTLLRGGPQKAQWKNVPSEWSTKNQYNRNVGQQPQQQQWQHQRHQFKPKYYQTHTQYKPAPTKKWPQFAAEPSVSYMHQTFAATQPAAASLHWNQYALPPDQSANLIFSDFYTFFDSLHRGVYPGRGHHMAPVYYKYMY